MKARVCACCEHYRSAVVLLFIEGVEFPTATKDLLLRRRAFETNPGSKLIAKQNGQRMTTLGWGFWRERDRLWDDR